MVGPQYFSEMKKTNSSASSIIFAKYKKRVKVPEGISPQEYMELMKTIHPGHKFTIEKGDIYNIYYYNKEGLYGLPHKNMKKEFLNSFCKEKYIVATKYTKAKKTVFIEEYSSINTNVREVFSLLNIGEEEYLIYSNKLFSLPLHRNATKEILNTLVQKCQEYNEPYVARFEELRSFAVPQSQYVKY